MDARFVVGLGEVLWDMFPKGKRLGGAPIPKAHALAVQVSAYVCTQKGAMPVIPEDLIHCFRSDQVPGGDRSLRLRSHSTAQLSSFAGSPPRILTENAYIS